MTDFLAELAALIEPSNAEQADWPDATFAYVHRMQDALRDLTAENERLTEQRDFLGAQAADLALKVGRLKALGDGLAVAARNRRDCERDGIACPVCAEDMSAARAAWETRDEA